VILGLEAWLRKLQAFVPAVHMSASRAASGVFAALAAAPSRSVLVHGDFSDKQVIVGDAGQIGIIDWDTLALGEAALDLGNMIAKVEVRAMQGLCTQRDAEEATAAFLAGYRAGPDVVSRMRAYTDAARLRLASINAFRPAWAGQLPARLLARIAGSDA
jgi:aminoglycoside phosphotransferase (APT) family kinase protein